MRTVLIVTGGYLPGYKFGGPVLTIKNLVERLGEEYNFHILTSDRDYGDDTAYPEICYDCWNQVGSAKVWYASPKDFNSDLIRRLAESADVLYVCGCFADYARAVMRLKRRGSLRMPVVIASMGMLSPGALHIKYFKKKAFIIVGKWLGWFRGIIWSVTSETELSDVRKVMGDGAICQVARDIPRKLVIKPKPIAKKPASLNIVFLSRISPKKNLEYALNIIKNLKGNILFDVYGVMEDEEYYQMCMSIVDEFPPNVIFHYKGAVPSDQVLSVLHEYHIFVLPTKGENFGHVIYEAMAAGCIPVISNRTPWNDLEEQRVGRFLRLENLQEDAEVLQFFVDMEEDCYLGYQKNVTDYVWRYWENIDCAGYRQIFDV